MYLNLICHIDGLKLSKVPNHVSNSALRYKLAFSQSRIASYLFDGKGYALISNIERRGTFNAVTRFDISVRTIASDGVLFLMVNEVSHLENL